MKMRELDARVRMAKAQVDKDKYIAELKATAEKWIATINDLTSMQNANMRARSTIASNPFILADPSAAANAANIIGSGAMSNTEGQGANDMARIFTPGNLQFGGSGTISKMVSPTMLQKLLSSMFGNEQPQQSVGQSGMVPMPPDGVPVLTNGNIVEHGRLVLVEDPYGKRYWFDGVTGKKTYIKKHGK